jgi:hypothetical protein
MNAERVSAEAVLAVRRVAAFIANMINVGGCASAGFAEAGALVPPTSVGGAPPACLVSFCAESLHINEFAVAKKAPWAKQDKSVIYHQITYSLTS